MFQVVCKQDEAHSEYRQRDCSDDYYPSPRVLLSQSNDGWEEEAGGGGH